MRSRDNMIGKFVNVIVDRPFSGFHLKHKYIIIQ